MSMFEIELHTFLILVELLMAIYAITAFFVYLVRRHVMHLSMAFSFVISMGAFGLLHSFIDAPTDIVVVVYNFLFLLSTVLIIIGFRAYYKLRIMPRRYYLYLLASVVGIYFFLNIIPDYIGRVSVNTFFLALFLGDALVDARLAIQNEPVKTRRAVYATMGFLMAFFILRLVLVIMTADPTHTLLENLKTTTLTTGFFSVITFNFWLVGSMLLQSDRMIIGLNAKSKKMEDLAMLDPLSKLYNRNKLEVDLEHIVEMSNRSGDIASILLMDIDHFKQINDQLGHDVGDEVLVLTSQIITGLLRTDDQVYRWGGDEFLILARHTDLNGAGRLAQRIIDKVSTTTFPKISKISVSIGCAQHFQYESKRDWFKRVDLTLYKAKQTGRNRFELWSNKDILPTTVAKLVWNDSYESGHPEIDNQHKNLLRLSNELYDLLGSADSFTIVDEILDRVQQDLSDHFTYEIKEIFTHGFPFSEAHQELHDNLLSEYAVMRDQLRQGKVNLGAFFNFFSVKIVAEHIIKEDSKFFTYLKSHQS